MTIHLKNKNKILLFKIEREIPLIYAKQLQSFKNVKLYLVNFPATDAYPAMGATSIKPGYCGPSTTRQSAYLAVIKQNQKTKSKAETIWALSSDICTLPEKLKSSMTEQKQSEKTDDLYETMLQNGRAKTQNFQRTINVLEK